MMIVKNISLLFFLFVTLTLAAQPEPCPEEPMMTAMCETACVICDIDGFTGRHDGNSAGEAPPGFCTFVVHNGRWIAFIAGSEELTIALTVDNCVMGQGLEVGIYEGVDCQEFRLVSECWGGTNNPIGEGTTRQFSNTEPLIIGQYYYLVMDGAFGDNCDWTFDVVSGSTQAVPLDTAPEIIGSFNTCPELLATYYTPGLVGGTNYAWTLDGSPVGDSDTISITWPGAGSYELCLDVTNACDRAPLACRTVQVAPLQITQLNPILCAGECFELFPDEELCEAGNYTYEFQSVQGCDSLVNIDLVLYESPEVNLSATICEGDSLRIGGQPYFTTGQHVTVLENFLGCDSTVTLDLAVVVCEIEGALTAQPVVCAGESSGSLTFSITDGTAPYSYSWQQLGGSLSGSGNLLANDLLTTLEDLPAGTYLISINDNFDNDLILIGEVLTSTPLLAELLLSDYNGWPLSCADASDGEVLAVTEGGWSPYNYSWSNGSEEAAISGLAPDNYVVQITDAEGCVISLEAQLEAPPPLQLTGLFSDPDCSSTSSGRVGVQSISGGVNPYQFALNNGPFTEADTFTLLTSGEYELLAQDANNCLVSSSGSLQERLVPQLLLPSDTVIPLAETVLLAANMLNGVFDSILWSPAAGLSCVDCLRPQANPVRTMVYQLAVTSADGCTTIDSVRISVDPQRDVYVPNAFSPNNDGVNDQFFIYGGPEVLQIRQFQIYSRWGDLVYSAKDLLPNSTTGAWDGRFGIDLAPSETYVWWAEIEFVDGVVQAYAGDVLLLR